MAGMSKFTQKAKRVLSLAQQEAEEVKAKVIGTEHLLLGLIIEEGTAAKRVLDDLGVELDSVRVIIKEMHGKEETDDDKSPSDLGDDVKRLLEQALAEAQDDKAAMVGTEHLILAMARDENSTAMRVLSMLGLTPEQVIRQTVRVMEEYQRMQDEIHKASKQDEL